MESFWLELGGKIAVDGHHHQHRAGDVAHRFETDGEGGDGGLNPVRPKIMGQAAISRAS